MIKKIALILCSTVLGLLGFVFLCLFTGGARHRKFIKHIFSFAPVFVLHLRMLRKLFCLAWQKIFNRVGRSDGEHFSSTRYLWGQR